MWKGGIRWETLVVRINMAMIVMGIKGFTFGRMQNTTDSVTSAKNLY